jgi:O-antigen ligase
MRRLLGVIGSALFALPAMAAWNDPALTPSLTIACLGAAVAAAAIPAAALLVLLALLPVFPPLNLITGAPSLGEEVLVVVLFVTSLRLVISRRSSASVLDGPVVLLLVVLGSSTVIVLSRFQQETIFAGVFWSGLWSHLTIDYFRGTGDFPVVHDFLIWSEGLVLAATAGRLLATRPDRQDLAVRLFVLGAGGLAAFSSLRLAEISLRAPNPLAAAAGYLAHLRFNPFYRDLNAAGSAYALFVVPAVWLAWTARVRWMWLIAAFLGIALWLAGSRTALAGALAGLVIVWAVAARPARRVLAGALAAAAALIAVVTISSGRNLAAGPAVAFRVEVMRVGWQLTETAPMFGVGLGNFQPLSIPRFTDAAIRRFPTFSRGENAHNNFLQILAELGAAGLASFLLVLGVVAAPLGRRLRQSDSVPPGAAAVAGGLIAFLLTCLAGHPLLIDHVRLLFFAMLGVGAGLADAPPAGRPARGSRAVSWIAALLLLLLPMRLWFDRRAGPPAGAVYGAANVKELLDDVRYRRVDGRSAWFIAPGARAVELSLRTTPESPSPCRVEVDVDTHRADTALVVPDAWTHLVYQLPGAPAFMRARRVDLTVLNDGCRLLVGPVEER